MHEVSLAREDTIALVTLNRPAKLNAISRAMLDALDEIARDLDRDTKVRCVILTGAGDRAFCVGADVNEWSQLTPLDMWRGWIRRGHQVFDRWAQLRVPVIAALNGHALGGGLELAAVADIRVAAEHAEVGLPEPKIGTCPGWSGTQRLVKLVGSARVKYLALTGRRLNVDEAWRIGIVHEIARDQTALDCARQLAQEISGLAPLAVQLSKQMIDAGVGDGLAMALEGMAGALSKTTRDAAEGQAAFREKRPPRFEGQ